MVTLQEQEARRDTLSSATTGAPILINGNGASIAAMVTLHSIPDGVVDAVWLQVWNPTDAALDFSLVAAPSSIASVAATEPFTVVVEVPPKDSLWILQGDSFRKASGVTPTLLGFEASGANELRVTGYIVRTKGASLHV